MNKMINVSEAFDRDITSLAWSPNGLFIVCGDRESKVRTLDSTTLALLDVKDTHVVPKLN
jgi:WD40 repeat protein